jgi:hypothetical protein
MREPISLGIVSRERRDMAPALLTNHSSQIIHDHEMIFCGEIVPRRGAEAIETAVDCVMNLDRQRMQSQQPAELAAEPVVGGLHRIYRAAA